MIITPCLSFLLCLLCREINGGLTREGVFEERLVEQTEVSQNEPESPMVQRDTSQGNMNLFGSMYPENINKLIEGMLINIIPPGCKNIRISCTKIPYKLRIFFHTIQPNLEKLGTFETTPALTTSDTEPTTNYGSSIWKLSNYLFYYNDPKWWGQWYMQDYRTTNIPVMDHNVVPVHDMGYTGAPVTIALLGSGIREHPDLGTSLVTSLGYDFCEETKQVCPNYWLTLIGYLYNAECNYHAGVIAMSANNKICGVGIAPNARIAAFKMSGCGSRGRKQKDLHSRPLSSQLEYIDIYCNTWTFKDDKGTSIFPLNEDAEKNMLKGINKGRNSKGAIYIFPSGRNRANSNCATNGYVNNPYVITIASANQHGKAASYSESCSAVFATAYSGDVGREGLVTIDANGECAISPNDLPMGPSVAAGIIALLLESKPSLKYRDVMHIIAMTAEVAPLADNPDTWFRNARGFWVSRDFGFGLLNAENMVNLAKDWMNVGDKNTCLLRKKLDVPIDFDHKEGKKVIIDASGCRGGSFGITYLEHIELEVNVAYRCRGAISINITSPAGTKTTLLDSRAKDCASDKLNWNIMSTQYWGENPRGSWTITFSAQPVPGAVTRGAIYESVLKLHGLQDTPPAYPRKYAAFRLPNGQTSMYT